MHSYLNQVIQGLNLANANRRIMENPKKISENNHANHERS
jgi:hypothetical protein